MRLKSILAMATAAGLALVLGAATYAQVGTTLLLRNGDRISGDLVDMGGTDFTLMVNGQERRIPISDVTVIDFVGGGQGLPDTEISKVPADGHIMFLTAAGTPTVVGTMTDIGGKSPLQITFRTANGERTVGSNEIGRIYLAKPHSSAHAVAEPTTGQGAPAGAITVPGNTLWTATPHTVRAGERVTFSTTGKVWLSGDNDDVAEPAGSLQQRLAPGTPLPNVLAGALIGRVGNGQPFGIGNQVSVPMPAAGVLYLGINDNNVSDNRGEFHVTVVRTTRRR